MTLSASWLLQEARILRLRVWLLVQGEQLPKTWRGHLCRRNTFYARVHWITLVSGLMQFDLALLGLHYMEPLVQLAEGVLMIVAAAIAYQSSVIMACGPSWVHLADPILGVFLTLMQVGKFGWYLLSYGYPAPATEIELAVGWAGLLLAVYFRVRAWQAVAQGADVLDFMAAHSGFHATLAGTAILFMSLNTLRRTVPDEGVVHEVTHSLDL